MRGQKPPARSGVEAKGGVEGEVDEMGEPDSWVLRSGWSTLARIDPRNDGQVIASDSIIPGSRLLGYANSDHWALVLPFALKAPAIARLFATRNAYPRVVLLESITRFLEERYLTRAQ